MTPHLADTPNLETERLTLRAFAPRDVETGVAHLMTERTHAYHDHGWSTLVSYIDPENARSIALAKRLGCTLDAKARLPDLPDWEGTLIYRHPKPKGTPDV